MTSYDREEEEYQRQLEEATRQSQADYMRKLEEDNRFYSAQWDAIYQFYLSPPSSPGGPNRRFDEKRTLTRTMNDSWQSLQGQYKARSDTDVGIPQRTILYFGKDFL